MEVFLEHPLEYVLTVPVGLYRVLLGANNWGLPVWIGVAWNGALLASASFGLWWLLRNRRWAEALFLFLPCAYFVTGILIVQSSGIDTRGRVMVTPLLAIMAAYGIMRLVNRRRAASASPSPPAYN